MRSGLSLFVFAGLCVAVRLWRLGLVRFQPLSPPSPIATSTVLTATPNPVSAGANVSLSATVSSTGGTPSGNVSFFDGTTNLGTAALSNGTASLTLNTLAAGATHSITASYVGTARLSGQYLRFGGRGRERSSATGQPLRPLWPRPRILLRRLRLVTLTATVTSSNTSATPAGSVSFLRWNEPPRKQHAYHGQRSREHRSSRLHDEQPYRGNAHSHRDLRRQHQFLR